MEHKMSHLNPDKLHVTFEAGIAEDELVLPRTYTLTHSDSTGDLFLTIAQAYNLSQISGLYTRLMRDEVLAQWEIADGRIGLQVHCHVSGGFIVGNAGWRESIFRQHMPMVLEAFRWGDKKLFQSHPELDEATILIHFHRKNKRQDKKETGGQLKDYRL
jgi:hypothetical protein